MTDFSRLPVEFLSDVLNDRERFGFYVAGVEVTQAIQWYDASQHLTDKADQGPDNAVTLVANKPTWARIYVGGLIAHDGVTATLTLQPPDGTGVYVDAYTPIQQGYASVDYDPTTTYANTRRYLPYTLNFVIPRCPSRLTAGPSTAGTLASGAISGSRHRRPRANTWLRSPSATSMARPASRAVFGCRPAGALHAGSPDGAPTVGAAAASRHAYYIKLGRGGCREGDCMATGKRRLG